MAQSTPEQGEQPMPEVDLTQCTGCGICVRICPEAVLSLHDRRATVARPTACTYIGLCERVCPTGAIRLPFEIVVAQ